MNDSLGATLAAVRRPSIRRALLSYLTFSVAEWATWVALLIWAFDRNGVGGASLISIVQLAPAVVVAPLAAGLGDRLRRGHALALGYGLQGVTMLVTALALALDAPFAVVAVLGAAVTCAVTLTRPVHNAVLPSLAETPAELTAGNAATSTAEAIGTFLGPLSCGLLFPSGGAESVFMLFGVLMLAAASLVVTLPARSGRPTVASRESARRGAAAGVRELRRDPAAAVLVGMVAGQYVVVGALDILVIMVALDVLETDSSGPGLLVSALGIGGILGALATVALVGRTRLSPALAVGVLVTGVPLMLLPLGAVPATAAFLLAVSGAGKSFFDVAGRTLLQRAVPDHVLARVFGVQESVMTASIAVGAALAPLAVAALGRSGAMVAIGALLPVAGLVAWHWLRRLDAVALLPGPHLSLLRGVPSLRLAPLRVLEALSRGAEELDLPAGALVVREGDPGDRFYVVLDGEVVVLRGGQEVRRLGAGDSFGEIALLRDVPRTATVRAVSAVRLVTLRRGEFLRVVGSDVMTRDEANAVAQAYLDADTGGGQAPVEP